MIKYLTKVGNDHILYVNEKSVKVEEKPPWTTSAQEDPREFKYWSISMNDYFSISSSKSQLSEILIAVELVKEIKLSEGQAK